MSALRKSWPILAFCLALSQHTFAASLGADTTPTLATLEVTQLQQTNNGFRISLALPEIELETLGSSQLQRFTLQGSGLWTEEGLPPVPMVGSLFRLPPSGGVHVEVLHAEYETLTDINYAAFHESQNHDELDECLNREDRWFPGPLAEVGDPAIFHDFRVANLLTFPIQVNPGRNEARVYHTLDLEISFEGSDTRNTLPAPPTRLSKAMLPMYRTLLDWNEDELDEFELYRGGVQVVMRNDLDLFAIMEEWFQWKRERGWKFELLTNDGIVWSCFGVHDELAARYAEEPFDYIVVVGDDQGDFPAPPGSNIGNGAGDYRFSCIAGDDDLVDVGVGRISIMYHQDASVVFDKLVSYEKNPFMADSSWYLRGLVHNSYDSNSRFECDEVLLQIRNQLLNLGYTTVDTLLGITGEEAISYLEDGVSFYSHVGYCTDGLNGNEVYNIQTGAMWPVVSTFFAGAGTWSQETSTTEIWLRAENNGSPIGAIGAFGTATYAAMIDYQNLLLAGEMYSATVLCNPALGDMNLFADVSLYNNYYAYENYEFTQHINWHNLMGDPTTWIWTGIPQRLTVTEITTLPLGMQVIACDVFDAEGEPVADAWVTLVKDDNGDSTQVMAETDANGHAELFVDLQHDGDATLTVSGQNCYPVQQTIVVVSNHAGCVVDTVQVYENGAFGSSGDGDGVIENGETIALQVSCRNLSEDTVEELILWAESPDDYIDAVTGAIEYTEIEPGEAGFGNGIVLVEIDSRTPDSWLGELQFMLVSDDTVYIDYMLHISAPLPVVPGFVRSEDTGTCTIIVPITNTGGGDLAGGTIMLASRSNQVNIVQGEAMMPALAPGMTTEIEFEISASDNRIGGYPADMTVIISSEDNALFHTPFTLYLGEAETTDPTGPDRYGYLAFDNTDISYHDYAPDYEWIEIDPDADDIDFIGTSLELSDTGENLDDAALVELPFDVFYYGANFDEITVTTNGMAAFGDQRRLTFAKNRIIPDPLGPQYMLAPYWENFQTDNNSDILYYHDAENGLFIVEWSKVAWDIYDWTFEIILYDNEMYPTHTGDTDILFQYNAVPGGGGQHGYYDVTGFTAGIENGTQDDGLLYFYYNTYTPGSAEIAEGTAILFTTNYLTNTSVVEGVVRSSQDDQPVQNAIVTCGQAFAALTNEDGYFFIDHIIPGDFTVSVEADCFTPLDTLITVGLDDTLNLSLNLSYPNYELNVLAITDTLDINETTEHLLTIQNDGNGTLKYSFSVESAGEEFFAGKRSSKDILELDEHWDCVGGFALDNSEIHYRGLTFDGRSFWITGSDNFDVSGPNKLYRYSPQGEFLAVYDQPVEAENRSAVGMRGIDFHDGLYYGADNGILYTMTFENDEWSVVNSVSVPVNPARFLAVDPERNAFWMGDRGTTICCVDHDGQILEEYSRDDRFIHGLDLMPVPMGETAADLALLCWDQQNDHALFETYHPASEQFTQDPVFPGDSFELEPIGSCMMYSYRHATWTFACITRHEGQDSVLVWEMEPYTQWVYVPVVEGIISPGNSLDHSVFLQSPILLPGAYAVDLILNSNACSDNPNRVRISMIVPDNDVEDPVIEQPLSWALDAIWPNPFNPTTNIRYGLKEATTVHIRVYDVLGREVTTLKHESQAAGWHVIPFTAHDLASGVYFLRVEAGPLQETRKLILLK